MNEVETTGAWLSREDLDNARDRLPILYVHAIPVRVDDRGVVTHVGLLLRPTATAASARRSSAGACSTTSASATP